MAKRNITALIADLKKKGLSPGEILKELEARDPSNLKKHTFEVDRAQLAEFFRVQKKSGVKVKEAVSEALADWISKQHKVKKS